MTDRTRDLLVRGIAAAKAGDLREAIFYLEWALRLEPPLQQKIDAWYWLSEIQPDEQQQREYLEKILVTDPSEGRARRKLAILDGKLDPNDIVDPNDINAAVQPAPPNSSIERFTCPNCGGRMTYTANGQSLQCDYCESRQRLEQASRSTDAVPEGDFHVALATRRGHINPIWIHSVTCAGCGAELIIESSQLTKTCPYCKTPYALDHVTDSEIIPPEGILPLEITTEQAAAAFSAWHQVELPDPPETIDLQAVYLAVWTFDIGGKVLWKCQIKKDRQWLPLDGQEIVYHNDLPVFATQQLPDALHSAMKGFDFTKMVDFDLRYLAGVMAENYQLSAGDASLQARKIALDEERRKIESKLPSQVNNLRVDSTKMIVESFRLVLVPAYIVRFMLQDRQYYGLVNGQTGAVQSQKPTPVRKSFLDRLFG